MQSKPTLKRLVYAGDNTACSPTLLLSISGSSANSAEVGIQLVQHDDQRRPVRCLEVLSVVFSLARLENGHHINVSAQYFCLYL